MTKLIVVSLMLTTSLAHAEPPGLTPPSAESEPSDGSYRLETFGVDAAALGLVLVASAVGNQNAAVGYSMLGLGALTYVIGPSLVHRSHKHDDRADESIALRAGLPFALGLLGGHALRPSSNGEGAGAGIGLGILAGVVVASAVDIGYLSRGGRRFTPTIAPVAHGGMTVGLGGSF